MTEHGVSHHRPDALLLWEADEPNHFEDISAWVDTKLEALERHESQFESTMKATDESGMEVFRQRMRTRMSDLGAPHGVTAAEIFHLMDRL
jgi:LmbE family N-acetylglucosaminyl deacetylase